MPHTVSTVVRLREMLDGFMELPKEKRPPDDIWFDADEVEAWFDKVFSRNSDTSFDIVIDDIEG